MFQAPAMAIDKSERKHGAYMLQDEEMLTYAAREWTSPPTMQDFAVLKTHLDNLLLDGKLGFSARALKRPKDISDVWKKISTPEHRAVVAENTAATKLFLEAAGVKIADRRDGKEAGLLTLVAEVRAVAAGMSRSISPLVVR